MAEGVACLPLAASDLEQELRVDRRSESADHDRVARTSHPHQKVEVESRPDDRRAKQDVLRFRRQLPEAVEYGVAQGVRNRDLGDLLRPLPGTVAVLDVPALDERAQDLLHKEWIALAGLEYCSAELDGRWPVQFHGLAQESRDVVLAQPVQPDIVSDAIPA